MGSTFFAPKGVDYSREGVYSREAIIAPAGISPRRRNPDRGGTLVTRAYIKGVQSYFDTLLRYVLSVTFCWAVVMKVMDQKTLVKRRWSYQLRRTVYVLTLSEFARHEFTNIWLETLPDILCLSLTGIRLGPKQARRVNDSTASLSLTERWTITEIRRQSNSVLTYSLLTDVLPL